MFLLILLSVILIASIVFLKRWFISDALEIIGVLFSVFSGLGLLICLIVVIVSHTTVNSELVKYETLKSEIQRVRSDSTISEIERAAIFKTILGYNQQLAQVKYWNNTWMKIYFPDTLAKLEPLR